VAPKQVVEGLPLALAHNFCFILKNMVTCFRVFEMWL